MACLITNVLLVLGFFISASFALQSDDQWKDQVRGKLLEKCADNPEHFTRIMYFLDKEDQLYGDKGTSPIWKTLSSTKDNDKLFEGYVNRLVEDTRTAEEDKNYKALMARIWSMLMKPSDEPGNIQDYQWISFDQLERQQFKALGGLAKAWSMVPGNTQKQILNMIGQFDWTNSMANVGKLSTVVNTLGGDVVLIGLATINMGYEAWENLNRWWNGEISGQRAAKNIADGFASVCGGAYGGLAGAAYGSTFGPAGTIVGGLGGSILGGHAASVFSDWLTQKIFNLPKSEALENAYNYFGVPVTASAEEINTKYRELSLKHHPDKGGRAEDFHKVQIHMGIIKIARGQTTNYE